MNGTGKIGTALTTGSTFLLALTWNAAPGQEQNTPKISAPALAKATNEPARIGNIWNDPRNPIVKIFGGKRRDLWSLKAPKSVPLPAVRAKTWVTTPVDRFILAGLEARGLKPSPEADRRTLIRRLSFDLIGLPPTPDEVHAFLTDKSPNAYRSLVERLLASPHYGERWGRHWLDVVRYADTCGFERDEFRPNTYRYRDYVIRAFNADRPYNQFVKEQLAGDEMLTMEPPKTAEEADKIVATGFLRLGQYDSTGSIFEEDRRGRDQLMGDLANTTGSAFLGLTVACANCHDHKYDPISQADHFRLRAFFAGVRFRDDLSLDLPAERAKIERHNAALDTKIKADEKQIHDMLEPAKQKIIAERRAAFPADIQALLKTDEANRDEATKDKLKPFLEKLNVSDEEADKTLSNADRKQRETLAHNIEMENGQKKSFTLALAMTDSGTTAPPTHLFAQGDYLREKDEIAPGFLSFLDPNPALVRACKAGNSTGRRTTLAEWIASPQNPFTARVMVNRIWQHHFGTGIVKTPNDFGYSGTRPTNQSLLDWLANEFVRKGWSVKQMHRLIVLSAAYRQASTVTPLGKRMDPDNALLWRQNLRRHEAETLRDSLLAVSGLLLPAQDGPPRWPPVPQDLLDAQPSILETHSDEAARKRLEGWYADPIEKTDVRTVFLIQKRCLPTPFLQPFDLQDSAVSCPARTSTTVAPQALTLLNSELTLRASRSFAARLEKEAGTVPAKQVERAFRLALARKPDTNETRIALDLLARHTKIHARNPKRPASETPARAALTDLCRVLLNLNEFVYVD